MPSVGRPVTSFAEFIADIQTIFYRMIADLTARVDTLESKSSSPPGSAAMTYVSTGSITNYANLSQNELLNVTPMFGSSTIPGNTLAIGSTIVINVNGYNSTGGSPETLTLRLLGSPEPPIIACDTQLVGSYSGPISMTIFLTVQDTSLVVNASIINGTTINSAFGLVLFDRTVDCPLTLTSSWSDSEAGGMLTIESRTIEIKSPPA